MRLFSKTTFVAAALFLATGCASIVSKSNWPFSVDTTPEGANVSITNAKGVEVYSGKTPAAMKLKSGNGFFSKQTYVVTLTMAGYDTKKVNVECKLNGWYFGNILLGGVIGMLIVDPATGAMYKLDSDGISETLTRTGGTTLNNTQPSLQVINKNQLTPEQQAHLVKISK